MRFNASTSRRGCLSAAGAATSVLLLTSCATSLGSVPLPAPGQLGRSITVTAAFANVMNLPQKAKVKLGGADIGEVDSIRTSEIGRAHV